MKEISEMIRRTTLRLPKDLQAPLPVKGLPGINERFSTPKSTENVLESSVSRIRDSDDFVPSSAESSTEFLPTRLIDVGSFQGQENIHLTLSDEITDPEDYVALSHCWGSDETRIPLRLLKSNKATFLKEIPWALLPLNFRDAVTATQMLGIRYLWIDSLCIIQDSGPDWNLEAGRMTAVYSNAFCTLAASAATDPTQGFLRQAYKSRPGIVKVRNSSTRQGPVAIQICPQASYPQLEYIIESSPLNSRGWALQERLLSR